MSITTYPAQKLTIKSMRSSHFKLVVNVKDSGGSNYDFTPTSDLTDGAFIKIYRRDGFVLENSPEDTESISMNEGVLEDGTALHNDITASVEDGKLTFEWDINSTDGYTPWPGKYKYHIFSENADNGAATIWLYGDFVVIDNNQYINSSGLTEQ